MSDCRLSIIVVTWNSETFVGDCLRSVERATRGLAAEVLVVDSASADATCERVAQEFPGVSLIANEENVGFARANNQALRRARGRYCLLLNPDTVIEDPDTLRAWLAWMDDHPAVAASGVRLVLADGRRQVGDGGFRPTLGAIAAHYLFLSKLSGDRIPGVFLSSGRCEELAVDWICGADFLVRAEVLPRVGLLEEEIFMYAEDVEWGCRMRDAGLELRYLPEFEIRHLQGACADQSAIGSSVMWIENLRALQGRYSPRAPAFLFAWIVSAGLLLRTVLYGLAGFVPGRAGARDRSRQMFRSLRAWQRAVPTQPTHA